MNRDRMPSLHSATAVLAIAACIAGANAQASKEREGLGSQTASEAELETHLDQLTTQLESMRQQLQQSQTEMDELRAELHRLRGQLAERSESSQADEAQAALRAGVEKLREDTDVLKAEVKQHDQTKVETFSKYPVRIGGTILFTSVGNSGSTDNIDVPIIAIPTDPDDPEGSLSATVRQTILSINASGPRLGSAKTSGDLNVDFFGGMPYADYTTASGFLRLRTGHARLSWTNREVTAAFDRPAFSPWQPTSWVTVGEPAMAWAGNLWTWTPQLQYHEGGILPSRKLSLDLGLMDPAAPGPPDASGERIPNASEQSKQPGYEARVGYKLPWFESPAHIGAGGYYSRQSYTYDRHVDAWVATADWNIAFTPAVGFSGQFYRGRGIGGLGGGTFKDIATFSHYQYFRGLDAVGGWGELKFVFSPTLEANMAFGQDNGFANDLRDSDFATSQNNYYNLARNQDVVGNLIFRPKTYLLFSAEFRRIHSWPIAAEGNVNRVIGMAAGYSF
jgi:regulator of replication initiation timing